MATLSKGAMAPIPSTLILDHTGASAKINEGIAGAEANSVTNKHYLVPSGPPASPAKVIIPGQVQGFCSGSTEYALSVIGVLCIVYGIVAK